MEKRLLAMSDIHGQYDQMVELLRISEYNPETDQLILCGDYVDRGPKVKQVIEKVIELVEGGAIALRGNHDDMMILNILEGDEDIRDTWIRNGGDKTNQQYAGDNKALYEHTDWMDKNLKLYHETDDYIFVHATVQPFIKMENQNPVKLMWSRHQGYCGLGKLIVHGHTPVKEVTQLHDQLFIDTGSVFDNKLTMIELPSRKVWKV